MSEDLGLIIPPDSRPLHVSSVSVGRGGSVQLTIDTEYVQLNRWGVAQLVEILSTWLTDRRAPKQAAERQHLTPNELSVLRHAVVTYISILEMIDKPGASVAIVDLRDAMRIITAREEG